MKKIILPFLLSVLVFSTHFGYSQGLTWYQTDTVLLHSKFIQESFKLDVSKPRTWDYATNQVAWPLIVLFDSYNEVTHRHNLATIDVLTFHSQIPESIVVGVPFNQYNRYYLTKYAANPGDSLSGIEKMEGFIFDELIPYFKQHYGASGPVLLIGHSRTGFLTSYFMVNRYSQFQMAGSFSGFLDRGFENNDLLTFLAERDPGIPFSYYFSAGTITLEEDIYLQDLRQVNQILQSNATDDAFRWQFMEHPYSGHMANYNRSVHVALTEYFGPYSKILTDWLFDKLNSELPTDPLILLKNDFENLASWLGATISPQPVHFISIANNFMQKNKPNDALSVLNYAMELYHHDYDINYYYINSLLQLGLTEQARVQIEQNLTRIAADQNLDPVEQSLLQTDFRSLAN